MDKIAGAMELVAGALKCDVEMLSPESSMQNTPAWDSFAHVEIMLLLEGRFGVEVTEDNLLKFQNVEIISTLF